jgi:hypothetical protein
MQYSYKRFKPVPHNPGESQRLHACVYSPVADFIQDLQEYFKPTFTQNLIFLLRMIH